MPVSFKKNYTNRRYLVITFSFLISFLVVVLRLFYVQIISYDNYSAKASQQHWSSRTIIAKRGSIYSSDGFPLAGTQDYYLLYGEPFKVSQAGTYASELVPIISPKIYQRLSLDHDYTSLANLELEVESKLSSDFRWVRLANKVSPAQREEILSLGLDGLGFEIEPIRYYPENQLAAHILGFVGLDLQGLAQGYYGVEGYYNSDLRGKDGLVNEESAVSGDFILLSNPRSFDSVAGRDLHLTLDRAIQFLVETRLREAVIKYRAKSGLVLIVDPDSGKIISLAAFPSYNLYPWMENSSLDSQITGEEKEPWDYELLSNPAISVSYEPGSVMKPVTLAIGLDTGKINIDTVFDDSGPFNIAGYKIDNWDGKHYGIQNLYQLLQKSNNIGACWVGRQIGWEKYLPRLTNFGFGSILGIDLEGEEPGLLPAKEQQDEVRLCTVAFGQGISVTPLQMVMSYCSLINGGKLMRPYLVEKITEQGKLILERHPEVIGRVIKEEISKKLEEMLIEAVARGESKFYNLDNYRVGGKTGTAQIPLETGGYDPSRTNATFIGFLPSYKNFVMLVKLEQPLTSIYAAETAVPLWMKIVSDLAGYYGFPPDL